MDESVKTQQLLISYAMQKGGWKNMPLPQDWIQISHNTTILYINHSGCTILDIHPFKYLALGNDKEKKAVKATIKDQYDPKKRSQSYISCWATCPFPEGGWIKLYHVMKNSIVYYHAQSNTLTAKHPCRAPKHSKSPSLPHPSMNTSTNNDKLKKAHSASNDTLKPLKPNNNIIINNNASKYHRYRATTTPQDKQTQNKPRPSLFNLVKTQNTKIHKKSKSADSKSSHKSPKKNKHKFHKKLSFKHRRNAISDKESTKIKQSLSPKSKKPKQSKQSKQSLTKKEKDRDKKKKMFQFLTSDDGEDELELKLFNQEQDEETILSLSPPTMDIFIEKDIEKNKGKRNKYGKSHKKRRQRLSPSTPPPRASQPPHDLELDDGFNIVPSFLTNKSTKLSSSKSSSTPNKGGKKIKGSKGGRGNKKKSSNIRRTKSSFESHEITGGHSFTPKRKKSKSFKLSDGEKMEKRNSRSSPRKVKSMKYKDNINAKTHSNSTQISRQKQKNKKSKPKQSKTSKIKKRKSNHARDRSKTNQFFSDSGTSSSPIPKKMIDENDKKLNKKRTSSGPNGSKQNQRDFKRFHPQNQNGNNSISTRRQRPNANPRRSSKSNKRKSKGAHNRHNISIASMSKTHKSKKSEQEKQRRKKDKSSPRMNRNNTKSGKRRSKKYYDNNIDTDDEMPMPSTNPSINRGVFSKDSHHNEEHKRFSLDQLESKKPNSPTPKTKKMIKKNNKKLLKNERERKKVKFKINGAGSLALQKKRSSKSSITPDSNQSTMTQERTKGGFPSTYTRQRSKSNKFHRGNKIDGTSRTEEEENKDNNNDNNKKSQVLNKNDDGSAPKDLDEMIAIIKAKNKEKQSQPKQQFASSLNAYNWGKTNLSALNNSSYTHSMSKSVYVFQASRAIIPNFSKDSKSPRAHAHAASPRGGGYAKSRKFSNGFNQSSSNNKKQSREKKTRSNSLSRIRRSSESSTDSDSSSGSHGRAKSQRGVIKGRFKIASPNKRRRNAVGMNATNIQQQLLASFGGETSPNGDSSPSPEANAENGFIFVSHGSKSSYGDLSKALSPKSLPTLSTSSSKSKSPRYNNKKNNDKQANKQSNKQSNKQPKELESDEWKQYIAEQTTNNEISVNVRVNMKPSPSPGNSIRSNPTTPTLLPQSHSLNKDMEDKNDAGCNIDDDEDFSNAPLISQSKSDPVQMSPLITPVPHPPHSSYPIHPSHPTNIQTSQTSPISPSPQDLIDAVLGYEDNKDDKDEMDGMTILNYKFPVHHEHHHDDDDDQSDLDLVGDDMIKSNLNVINGSNSDEDHETGSIIFNDDKLNNSMIQNTTTSPNKALSVKSKSGSNIIDGIDNHHQHQGNRDTNNHRKRSQKRYRNGTDGDLLLRSMAKNAQNAQIRSDKFRRFSKSSQRSRSRHNVPPHGHRHRKTSRASSVSSTSSVGSSISDVDRNDYIGSRSTRNRRASSSTTTSSDDSSDDESSISSVSDSSTDSDDSSDDDNMSVSSNDSRLSRASSRSSRSSISRKSLSRSTTPSRRDRANDSNSLNARFTNSQNITNSLYNRMADMMLMMSHHSHHSSTNTYGSPNVHNTNTHNTNNKPSNIGLNLSPNTANSKGWVNMNGILSPPSIAQSAPNSNNFTQFGFSDPSMFQLDSQHLPSNNNAHITSKKLSDDSVGSNHSNHSNGSATQYKPQQFDEFMKKFMAGFNQSNSSNGTTAQATKSNTLHSYDSFASQRGHNNDNKGININSTNLSMDSSNIANDLGYKNRIASIMLTNSYADDTSCSASDNDADTLLDVKSV